MNILLILLSSSSIIATRPAENPEGKILSAFDVSLNRAVHPALGNFYWAPDGSITDRKPEEKTYRLPLSTTQGVSFGTEVSRNEFGYTKSVFPSNDGRSLAVYRKDESRVGTFPLLDINKGNGTLRNIRYPMNGTSSERLAVCICDTLGHIRCKLETNDFDDERYLTNISWSPDDRHIFVHVLDRAQHNMHLNMYSACDGSFERTVLSEHNDAWVEPLDPVRFVPGTPLFIYRTANRDGYRNLYLCDTLGHIRRLTGVDADVSFAGCDGKWAYYTSAELSPAENHLFRIRLERLSRGVAGARIGKPERLTRQRGWHNIRMSPDCSKYIDSRSSFDEPGTVTLHSSDGSLLSTLKEASNPLKEYAQCEVEFGEVPSADGKFKNHYRFFKPLGYDPSKKYPLIVYVYGGPHSQMVADRWLGGIRLWEMQMAQKGYAVYVQDNRGTSNHGLEYEQAINRCCGKAETEDQIAGLEALLERYGWIDRNRIGVHGWSYGGFMSLTLCTRHPEYFKTCVAGGPVIDWKWYEVMYGERYMDTQDMNPEGFRESSLLSAAAKLKARTLICQGAVDGTVVWEHSLSFIQECILAGVQIDYFPYPCDEHNMRGKAREHLYGKITKYFLENL